MRQRFGKAWLVWAIFTVAYFALFETLAIIDGVPGGTLSEWVWALMESAAFRVPFTIVYFGGLAWLTMHFFRKSKW